MKRYFVLFLLLMTIAPDGFSQFQKVDSYHIPSFKMTLSDGKVFNSSQLTKNKPLVLIYFAPDCDHCIVLLDQVFKKIHQLDKTNVVLVTFKPVQDLQAFEKKYQTAKYPNIKVGTEGLSYYLRNFYRLDKTPFTVVYDKTGKLAYFYKDDTPVNEMLTRLKKLI